MQQTLASKQTFCIPNSHQWPFGLICPRLFYSFFRSINILRGQRWHCSYMLLKANLRLLGNGCRCPSNGGLLNYTRSAKTWTERRWFPQVLRLTPVVGLHAIVGYFMNKAPCCLCRIDQIPKILLMNIIKIISSLDLSENLIKICSYFGELFCFLTNKAPAAA